MTYNSSDIVLVKFPFSSFLGEKNRPAVVISSNEFNSQSSDLTLLAITSKNNIGYGEDLVTDWQKSGLLKPSAFKSIIFTVEESSIYKKLGEISDNDKSTLISCLHKILCLK